MSLSAQGRGAAALRALLSAPERFDRIADKDLAAAASALAKKQLIASGQTIGDIRALKSAIGDDLFDITLKSLSAYHAKLLAKRLDKTAPEIAIASGSASLAHVRQLLKNEDAPASPDAPETEPAKSDATKGSYFGRKAFRTGN